MRLVLGYFLSIILLQASAQNLYMPRNIVQAYHARNEVYYRQARQ